MTVGSEKAEFLKCSMASKNTTTTPAARKRQKPEECDDDDLPDTSHYTQYFVMDPAEGHSLQKLSPFAIEKSMLCQVGTVRELKKLRSGTLLVRVASKGQAAAIVNLTQFAMVPVTVTAHKTLNTCRGVIRCRELRDCDDEEVMAELKAHGVISVHHVQATRSGKKEPTNTFILTFDAPTLPQRIKVGYLSVTVEQYIPNPLRCFKCQRYGHSKAACKRTVNCARCGIEGHDDASCTAAHHCFHCGSNHATYSRDCPEWKTQKSIVDIKYKQNISFREAKEFVARSSGGAPAGSGARTSYATVVKKSFNSTACQTCFTWPETADAPVLLDQTSSPLSSVAVSKLASTVHTAVQSTSDSELLLRSLGDSEPPSTSHTEPKPTQSSSANKSNASRTQATPAQPVASRQAQGKSQNARSQKGDSKVALLEGMDVDPPRQGSKISLKPTNHDKGKS